MNTATPEITETPASHRRDLPRIEVDSRAAIRTKSGQALSAKAHNVSPRGALLFLDRAAAELLRPGGKPITALSDERVLVCLELPIIGGTTRISVICRLAHFSVTPDGQVAFGMEFKRFQNDGLALLWRFITDSMIPAGFA